MGWLLYIGHNNRVVDESMSLESGGRDAEHMNGDGPDVFNFADDDVESLVPPSAFGFDTLTSHSKTPSVAPTIVVQHNYGTATLHQRRPAAPQPPPERRDAGANFITHSLAAANERYELTKIRLADRCAPRMERCYRRLSDLRRFFCCITILVVLIVVGISSLGDQTAYVEDSMRPQYVRHGHAGVDLHQPSVELQCSDVRSRMLRPLKDGRRDELSFDRVRASAEYLIRADTLSCVCGPALGSPRRYTAVQVGAGVIEHLHNPVIDRDWDGHIDDETSVNVRERSLVLENQRMLFPEHQHSVEVVRFNAVRVSYQDDECRAASLVLTDEHAWCVQACEDLFDGRNVYNVAVKKST